MQSLRAEELDLIAHFQVPQVCVWATAREKQFKESIRQLSSSIPYERDKYVWLAIEVHSLWFKDDVFRWRGQGPDLDNMAKPVLDALVEGKVLADDSILTIRRLNIAASLIEDKTGERTDVWIYEKRR
jgi:Holliday junction resolvase RusA-like endonuclease